MKFLVDAQLPVNISRQLARMGHDSVHAMDLPLRDRTPDIDLINLATTQNRIVITKDKDFYYSYLLRRKPQKLLLLTIGNLINRELRILLETHLSDILLAFESNSFIELTRDRFDVHE